MLSAALRWSAWGCVVLIAVLSLLPSDEMTRTSLGGHVEHAIAYAGTAFLLHLSYPGWAWKWPAIGLSIYAGTLEILQNFSPGRHAAVEDWLAGSIGALLGIGIARMGRTFWRA